MLLAQNLSASEPGTSPVGQQLQAHSPHAKQAGQRREVKRARDFSLGRIKKQERGPSESMCFLLRECSMLAKSAAGGRAGCGEVALGRAGLTVYAPFLWCWATSPIRKQGLFLYSFDSGLVFDQ